MPVPLYTCGLAEDGYDEPFHTLDRVLSEKGAREIHVSGVEAAFYLFSLGLNAVPKAVSFPIPYECPKLIHDHLQQCGPHGCDHEKQCHYNGFSWRSIEVQKSLPYTCRVSDRVAQRLVEFHLTDSDALREDISQKLQFYGDTILKRWRKMSKDKRGTLLSTAAPRVFGKWPVEIKICPEEGCYAEHFDSWPPGKWLNLRDFAEDWMKLISVLHVRTAYDSAAWVEHDLRTGLTPNEGNYFVTYFSDRCVVMAGDQFGRLTEYDSDALHANITVGFPRALATFQAQHELLYVLDGVLELLLKDTEPSGSEEWLALVSEGLHSAGRDVSWNPYIHQPFTAPVTYAAESLYQQSTERLSMVQDELMLLQTDPAYAQEVINLRKIALSNASGGYKREQQYECIGNFLMLELLLRFEMWHTISARCRELVDATLRFGGTSTPGSILPPEVATSAAALKASIRLWQRISAISFELLMCSTNLGNRQMSSFSNEHAYANGPGEVLDPHKPADRLKWHIKVVLKSTWHDGLTDRMRAQIFETIEREEGVAKFMDRPTREYINDMMTLDQILTRVNWTRQIEKPSIEDPSTKSDGCCVFDNPECRPSNLKFQAGSKKRIGALIHSLMDAPWPKGRKDLSWLAKANLTRERLARLWQGISTEYGKAQEAGGRSSACGTDFLKHVAGFAKDPAYQEQLAEERELCELESHKLSLVAEEKARALTGYVAQTQWGPDRKEKLRLQRKTKAKTKAAQPAQDIADGLNSAHLEDISTPSSSTCHDSALVSEKNATTARAISIAVKNESLIVFHKMFRADTQSTQGGTIRWQAFVQAMKDAGFTAEEAAGSAVSFRSSSLGGSICFHRPHPDPVLHPIMLYAMARRLAKWFGFTTETFVLRETEVET